MAANIYGLAKSKIGSDDYSEVFIKRLYHLVKEGNIPALIDIDFVRGICKDKILSNSSLWSKHRGVRIPIGSLPIHCLPFAVMDPVFGYEQFDLSLRDSIELYLTKVDQKMATMWTQDSILSITDECRQVLVGQIRTTCMYDICFDMYIHNKRIDLAYNHKNTLSSMCKIPSMHTKLGVSDTLEGARDLYNAFGRSSILAMYQGLSVIHRMVLEKKSPEELENMKADWNNIFSVVQRFSKAPKMSTFNGYELLRLTEHEGVFVFWLMSFVRGKLQSIDKPLTKNEMMRLDAGITKRCHEKFGSEKVDSHIIARVRDVLEAFVSNKDGLLGLVYSNFGRDKSFIVLNPRPDSHITTDVESYVRPAQLKSELDINAYAFKRTNGSLFIQDDMNTCN